MKPQMTRDGVEIQTFDEVYAELVALYKAIYGETINLDQDTPDGQKVGIEAKLSIDLQTFGVALYQAFDPDFSVGDNFNRIIKICGITRKPATQSSVVLTITTDRALDLDTTFTVQDTNNQNWVLAVPSTLAEGENFLTFYAQNYGDIQAVPNTINNIITIVQGVLSANNDDAAIPGVDEETDEELRIRRNLSLENPSYSTVGGLYAKLANLKGCTDLQVYENDTDSSDPDRPWTLLMPPHSIWIVILGATEADIAKTTALNKTGGTAMKGDQVANWIENRIRPNGQSFQVVHTIRFDRPTIVPLYIRLNVRRKIPTQPIDIELIKKKLITKNYMIGEDAQANELYCYVYQAGTNFIATDLEISIDDSTWTDGDIEAGYADDITISEDNITITEI